MILIPVDVSNFGFVRIQIFFKNEVYLIFAIIKVQLRHNMANGLPKITLDTCIIYIYSPCGISFATLTAPLFSSSPLFSLTLHYHTRPTLPPPPATTITIDIVFLNSNTTTPPNTYQKIQIIMRKRELIIYPTL